LTIYFLPLLAVSKLSAGATPPRLATRWMQLTPIIALAAGPMAGLALTSSLSDLKQRSENSPARGQILTVLQRQYRYIAQKTGEICTGPADLQPMLFKSDRLLVFSCKNERN
jgi:hypothetical protein